MSRERMPPERNSVTRKLRIGEAVQGYATVGLYPDGRPGELFLTFDKLGSTERGMAHALALVVSLALQRGVLLEDIVGKLRGLKFDPAGVTGDPEIPMADLIVDLVARWLDRRFMQKTEPKENV